MTISTEGLARAAARRPWRVISLWVVGIVAALAVVAILLGGKLTSEQRLTNNPSSYVATNLADDNFRNELVDDTIVVRSQRYTADEPRFRAFVLRLLDRTRATHRVQTMRSYYTSGIRALVSRDRHATLIPIVMGENPERGIKKVIDVVQEADRSPDFTAGITGHWTIGNDFSTLAEQDLRKGEFRYGAPAALFILVLVFGALVAAGLPLALALVAIAVALGLTTLIAQAVQLSIFVINMLTAVGLALGIDYTLFVLSRYREERARGREKDAAIAAAGATASRAVFFSGSAFAIALVGMLLVPDNIMRSLAAGAIIVAIVSVGAALTLTPALLALLGDRINTVPVPVVGRVIVSGAREGRFWGRVAAAVMRRPVISLVLSAALLLAAAYPVLDLKTGFPGVTTFPASAASRQGLELLDRSFRGGQASPVRIVVAGDVTSAAVRAGIDRLRARLRRDHAFGPSTVEATPSRDLALVSTTLPGGAGDPRPVRAVRKLRSDYIPAAFAGVDARVLVGGETAKDIDYFDTMDHWLPIVFAFVLGLSFLLLTVAFRSIVVALKAIVLNLLSVGAAYGLIVLVFEKGVGAGLLGFTQVDSVVAWVPLFLFCILFGMSMDYHVFLLSRIRERFGATGDNSEAVAYGVRTTARLITGAALIIIVVFVGFSTGELVMFQQMGFGVAVALLLDATVVRSVLVPAAMELLGNRNWYLPSWLRWLPELRAA